MIFKGIKIVVAVSLLSLFGCGPKYVSPVPEANEYFKQGMEHYNEEEYDQAMNKFIQTLSEDPGHKTAREYMDRSQDLLRQQIREDRAARRERLRRQQENEELIRQLRVDLQKAYEQERWARAEEAAKEILEYYPEDEEVKLYLEEIQDNLTKREMEQETEAMLNEAQLLRIDGEYEQALDIVEEVLTYFPANQKARELETRLNQEIEREKSEQEKEELFKEQRAENKYQRALNFMDTEDYVETILLLEDVHEMIPNYKQVERYLREAQQSLREQTSTAVEDSLLHRAVEREYKEAVETYLDRNYREALREFEYISGFVRLDRALRYQELLEQRLERLENQDKAEGYYLDAHQSYMEENIEEAAQKLRMALELYPSYPEARYFRREVENILDKESRINEYLSSAREEYERGNYADAMLKALEVFEIDEQNSGANDLINRSAAQLAGTQNIDETELENIRREADRAYSNENYREAVKNWAKVILVETDNQSAMEDIRHTQSVIEEIDRQRRIEAQRRNQREAARQKRQRVSNYLEQANELQSQGQHQKAIEVFEKILEEEPGHQEAEQGKQVSRAALEEEIPDGVDEARIEEMYREGLILYSEGRYSDAITQWRRVLNLAPEHERAQRNIEAAQEKLGN